MKITLEQILNTVRNSDRKFWDINDANNCPAAVTGKECLDQRFKMFGFDLGYIGEKSVFIDKDWAVWTENTESTKELNEKVTAKDASYISDLGFDNGFMVSKETILQAFTK